MCNGNESRLVDCERAGGVSHSCRALGYQQIGVSCLPPDIEGEHERTGVMIGIYS